MEILAVFEFGFVLFFQVLCGGGVGNASRGLTVYGREEDRLECFG